jgi:hypothetical protein
VPQILPAKIDRWSCSRFHSAPFRVGLGSMSCASSRSVSQAV